MKLTNRQLQRHLDGLANANSKAMKHRAAICEHCLERYGVEPADVSNDHFIDFVDGGSGETGRMTVKEFHQSMIDAIDLSSTTTWASRSYRRFKIKAG